MPIKPWLIRPQHTHGVYVEAGGGGDSARGARGVLWHALRVGYGRLGAASPITRMNPRACLRARARAHPTTGRQQHSQHPSSPADLAMGFIKHHLMPEAMPPLPRLAGHCHDPPPPSTCARAPPAVALPGAHCRTACAAQPHGILHHHIRPLCGREALVRAPDARLQPCSSAALLQQHATWQHLGPRDGAFGIAAPVRCIVGRETARSGVRRCVRRALRWSTAAALEVAR